MVTVAEFDVVVMDARPACLKLINIFKHTCRRCTAIFLQFPFFVSFLPLTPADFFCIIVVAASFLDKSTHRVPLYGAL